MKTVKTFSFCWCQKIVVLCVQVMLLLGASTVFAQHKTVVKKVFKVPQRACVLEPVVSDARIEKMKKEVKNEDDFYVEADDVNYYLFQAGELMKRHGQKAILVPATYTDILFPKGKIIHTDTIAIIRKTKRSEKTKRSDVFRKTKCSFFDFPTHNLKTPQKTLGRFKFLNHKNLTHLSRTSRSHHHQAVALFALNCSRICVHFRDSV